MINDPDLARRIIVSGVPHWLWPDGTQLPVISGGADDDDDDDKGGDDGDGDDGSGDNPKSFTQDDVDRIINDRLRREREKHSDYDDLKAKASKYDELEEQNKSELQKAQDAQKAAEAERDQALDSTKGVLRRASIIAAASKAGAVEPEDVAALLPADAVTVTDDGEVEGTDEAVKTLLEKKPHLKATSKAGRSGGEFNGDNGEQQLTRDDLKSMSAEQITEAKEKGRLDKLLGKI